MTVKGPQGRMTKALTTAYNVGDVVRLANTQPQLNRRGKNGKRAPRLGDEG